MGGVVSAITGGGKKKAAPAPAPEEPKASKAETQMARERAASMRARRGGRGRLLGGEATKLGE